MRVSGVGEDGILAVLNHRFARADDQWPQGTVGRGDDAAVVMAPDQRFVITVDSMAENYDFRQLWPSGIVDNGYSTGWKAAAQNLSDINAMGATASSLVVSLTLPPQVQLSWVDHFAAGVVGAMGHLGVHACGIAGGDLGAADTLSVSITATGTLDGSQPVLRTASGQYSEASSFRLMHCGNAGWAAAGFEVLETPRDQLQQKLARVADQDPNIWRTAVRAVRAQLRPRPPLGVGLQASASVAAMMDVSDGIQRDAGRLARANGMRVELDEAWVQQAASPLRSLAEALDADAASWVRRGGEDYGLLALAPASAELDADWQCIGQVSREADDAHTPDELGGWDHFSSATTNH